MEYQQKAFVWYFANNAYNNNKDMDRLLDEGWEIDRSLGTTNKRGTGPSDNRAAAMTFVVLRRPKRPPEGESSYADNPYAGLETS